MFCWDKTSIFSPASIDKHKNDIIVLDVGTCLAALQEASNHLTVVFTRVL